MTYGARSSTGASATRGSSILLHGPSTDTVAEFFEYAVCSILYQRGVYPPEQFEAKKAFGLSIMAVKDLGLKAYLKDVFNYFTGWLKTGTLQKAVLVIMGGKSGEVLERWSFDVSVCGGAAAGASAGASAGADGAGLDGAGLEAQQGDPARERKTLHEIQAIIRQITASVTFLPLLEETCSIDLLAYTDKDAAVPDACEESDAKIIPGGANVQLRSFSTSVHTVDAVVSYRQQQEREDCL
jgi:mitotic spindle assembly checkpoint protein MAD2